MVSCTVTELTVSNLRDVSVLCVLYMCLNMALLDIAAPHLDLSLLRHISVAYIPVSCEMK